MTEGEPLLEVRNLRVEFRADGAPPARAVDGLSFSMAEGEGLALLGESGSGKTATALAVAGLLPAAARITGSVRLGGRELLGLSDREMRRLRGSKIGFVFQEPSSALNPVLPVGEQVAEAVRLHGRHPKLARHNALDALRGAGFPDAAARFGAYPHELSGGLRQRACIAMAVVNRPQLLIADEPTSALDVSVQAGILDLFAELRTGFEIALLLITHDLRMAARAAGRGLVLYAGRAAECARMGALLERPLHPYTKALIAALPQLGTGRGRLGGIPGSVPSAGEILPGCRFAPRCPAAAEVCRQEAPQMAEVLPGHWVACWQIGKVEAPSGLPEVRL
ncbi:MAG TPA: ABC transporter ATP-binding protein [Planctomycetota bacterium]|nr:ABC transporter ATP-binding protein [Planctomycetota bacterium]